MNLHLDAENYNNDETSNSSHIEYIEDEDWLYRSPSHINAVLTDPNLRAANLHVAKIHKRRHAAVEEENYLSPLHAHAASELSRLGVGIQLYFESLKQLIYLFSILMILYLPQAIFCMAGNMNRGGSVTEMSSSMIANLGYMPYMPFGLEGEASAQIIMERPVVVGGKSYDIRSITIACGLIDLFATILIITWIFYFIISFTPKLITENDEANHTMSDHTVMVSRLPKRASGDQANYAQELKEHFERILSERPKTLGSKDMMEYNNQHENQHENLGGKVTVNFDGVDGNGYDGNVGKVKKPTTIIYDVVLAHDYHGQMGQLVEVGQLKHELALLEAKRRMGVQIDPKKTKKIEKEIIQIISELVKTHVRAAERDVVAAFVTFTHPPDKDYIERLYEGSRNILFEMTVHPRLKFLDHSIRVETAPEPDDIIWENVDYPAIKRGGMIAVIWGVVLLLLFISFSIVAAIRISDRPEPIEPKVETTHWQIYADAQKSTDAPWLLCDVHLYSDYLCVQELKTEEIEAIGGSMTLDTSGTSYPSCIDSSTIWKTLPNWSGFAGLTWTFEEPTLVKCVTFNTGMSWTDQSTGPSNPGAIQVMQIRACEPVDKEEEDTKLVCTTAFFDKTNLNANRIILGQWGEEMVENCDMVDFTPLDDDDIEKLTSEEGGGESHEWYVECYCVNNLFRALDHFHACQEALKDYMLDTIMSLLASASVHVMNSVVKKIVRHMVKYEKPWSHSQRLMLGMTKIFTAQYINTAWIVLLINTKFTDHVIVSSKGKQITGEFAEANSPWYKETGADFATVSFFHIFFPHILKVAVLPILAAIRHFKAKHVKTQEELNELYENEEFKLDTKYAAVGAMVCFCFTYCSSMPMVILFTTLAVVTIYWCDKLDLLWCSERPPAYDSSLSNVAIGSLFLGVFFHTLFSCATMGHPLVFPSYDIGNWNWKMLGIDLEFYDEEHEQFVYDYETEKGLFTSAFWPRTAAYFFSGATFAQFLLFCLIVVFALALLFFIVFIMSGALSREKLASLINKILPGAEQHTEDDDIYKLIEKNQKNNRISTYRLIGNERYRPVYGALAALDRYGQAVEEGQEAGVELLKKVFFEKRDQEQTPKEVAMGHRDNDGTPLVDTGTMGGGGEEGKTEYGTDQMTEARSATDNDHH